jgi:transposase-like protein
MKTSILSEPQFHNDEAAFAKLESILWPHGPVCPRCGGLDRITRVKGGRTGLWRCGPCKRQFTVTVGTLFERSHVPLHKWFQAAHLLASSKKGISAHQLHRTLNVDYKTAWFMEHRLREAMKDGSLAPLGGEGKVVEADETYIGNAKANRDQHEFVSGKGWQVRRTGGKDKFKVVSLVERKGSARSMVFDHITANAVTKVLRENVDPASALHTDTANVYTKVGKEFADHQTVNHREFEWGRGDAHTNTIEGFFSIFKRGMKGVYQHCSEKHLHRYLAEFDFRYSNRSALGCEDQERASRALTGIVGRRLMYRDSSVRAG